MIAWHSGVSVECTAGSSTQTEVAICCGVLDTTPSGEADRRQSQFQGKVGKTDIDQYQSERAVYSTKTPR